MLSVWKHSSLYNPLLLGEGKDFVHFAASCFSSAFFFFFSKCVVYLVLQRHCTQFPFIVHSPAFSCLHLSTTAALPLPAQPGEAEGAWCHTHRLLMPSEHHPGEHGEKLSVRKTQNVLTSNWLLPAGNSGHPQTWRQLQEWWQHAKSLTSTL